MDGGGGGRDVGSDVDHMVPPTFVEFAAPPAPDVVEDRRHPGRPNVFRAYTPPPQREELPRAAAADLEWILPSHKRSGAALALKLNIGKVGRERVASVSVEL